MGFDSRDTSTPYTPQDGDTLETIAQRETANGNPLTASEIALFNWGTDDPEVVNEYLRDDLDCYRRGEDNRFLISSDCVPRKDLLIPQPFEKSGLAINRIHTIRVRKRQEPPQQFLACVQVKGVTFEFNKSFIRPSVVDDIKKLEEALARFPSAKLLIFGHTDRVGGDQQNKELSERRALSTYAFITGDTDTWEMLYNKENWGTRAIQEILKDFGPPYDPGLVDGIYGPQTRRAVRQYQTDRGLGVDGIAGPVTRKEMFTEYMTSKHDVELAPDRFMDPGHMGCGEFNPVEESEVACEPNRRVTFFMFHPSRLPNLPCQSRRTDACRRQMDPPAPRFTPTFKCSFYDSIAKKCPGEGGGHPGLPTSALRYHRLEMLGVFEVNKSFMRSCGIEAIQYATGGLQPGDEIVVTGHTDPTGDPAENLKLSRERAGIVWAYMTHNVDYWLLFYEDGMAQEKRWSEHEDQLMIQALGDPTGQPWESLARILPEKGSPTPDPSVRRKLVKAYMMRGSTTPERFKVTPVGMGEANSESLSLEDARHFELFTFPDTHAATPPGDPDTGPGLYPVWVGQLTKNERQHCGEPSPGRKEGRTRLSVRVLKPGGTQGYPNVEVAFSRQKTPVGAWNTNPDGWIWNAQDTPGTYLVQVTGGLEPGHKADSQTVELKEGQDLKVPIQTFRVGTSTTGLLVKVFHKTKKGTAPLEGAQVELSISYSNVPNRHAATDKTGTCSFFGIEPGTYYVTATHPFRESQSFSSETKTKAVVLGTSNTVSLTLSSQTRVDEELVTVLSVSALQSKVDGKRMTSWAPLRADKDVRSVPQTKKPGEYAARLNAVLRNRHEEDWKEREKEGEGNLFRHGPPEVSSSWEEYCVAEMPPVGRPGTTRGRMEQWEFDYSGRCTSRVKGWVPD